MPRLLELCVALDLLPFLSLSLFLSHSLLLIHCSINSKSSLVRLLLFLFYPSSLFQSHSLVVFLLDSLRSHSWSKKETKLMYHLCPDEEGKDTEADLKQAILLKDHQQEKVTLDHTSYTWLLYSWNVFGCRFCQRLNGPYSSLLVIAFQVTCLLIILSSALFSLIAFMQFLLLRRRRTTDITSIWVTVSVIRLHT